MGKYLTEFIGTFFLVLTIGCSVGSGADLAPLAIGSILMVMIFAGGHVSGGHYNPAVTLAVTMRGRCSLTDAIPYVVAQVIGGAGGAMAAGYLLPRADLLKFETNPMDLSSTIPQALFAEALFTFAAYLRRPECRDGQSQCQQFVLWIGHRIYRTCRSHFGRRHFWRRLFNPRRGRRGFGPGPDRLEDICGSISLANLARCGRRRDCLQGDQSGRQVIGPSRHGCVSQFGEVANSTTPVRRVGI